MFSFIHISDLHIGRKLNSYDLLEDQKYALGQIVRFVEDLRPDAVLIAGDVFDRINPSEEATALLGSFLEELQAGPAEVFVIAGNHDPVEKLSFLSGVVDKAGLHIVTVFHGVLEKRAVGDADIYMLPYIRTVDVRPFFPEEEIASVGDAVRLALSTATLDRGRTNVLIAHQSVLGAVNGGSEDVVIGGESPISSSLFSDFDYVALGHIHRAQCVGLSQSRYSGSMLKYSLSEKEDKVALYGKIADDGRLEVEELRLKSLHGVVTVRGLFSEVMAGESSQDYVHVVLTDERDVPDAQASLARKFPLLLSMEYDNGRTRASSLDLPLGPAPEERSPQDYFKELFEMMSGHSLDEEQSAVLEDAVRKVWRDRT